MHEIYIRDLDALNGTLTFAAHDRAEDSTQVDMKFISEEFNPSNFDLRRNGKLILNFALRSDKINVVSS